MPWDRTWRRFGARGAAVSKGQTISTGNVVKGAGIFDADASPHNGSSNKRAEFCHKMLPDPYFRISGPVFPFPFSCFLLFSLPPFLRLFANLNAAQCIFDFRFI
jgi:hypothetical protein